MNFESLSSENGSDGPESTDYVDRLTGFANLNWLKDKIPIVIEEFSGQCGLLFLDVDGLKRINDSQGHMAGDEYIKQVANITNGCIRQKTEDRHEDIIGRFDSGGLARIHGDEFVVLLPGISSIDEVNIVKDRIQSALDQHNLQVSIGGSVIDDQEMETEQIFQTLLEEADREMYLNKENRKKLIIEALPVHKRLAFEIGRVLINFSGISQPR